MVYHQHIPSKYACESSQGCSKEVVLSRLWGRHRLSKHSVPGKLSQFWLSRVWVEEAEWLRSAVHGHTVVLYPSYLSAGGKLSYRWQTLFSPILDYVADFLWVNGHIPQVSRMYL